MNKRLSIIGLSTLVLCLGFLLDQSLIRQMDRNKSVGLVMVKKRFPMESPGVLIPIDLTQSEVYNGIGGWSFPASPGALMELGVYNSNLQLCVSTGVLNWPGEGPFQFSIPEWAPKPGRYYLAVSTNNPDAAFAGCASASLPLQGGAIPLKKQIGATPFTSPSALVPDLALLPKQTLPLPNYRLTTGGPVFAMCRDPGRHRIYGQRGQQVFASFDCGETWQPLMPLPEMKGHLFSMVVTGDRLYAFSSFGEVYQTNGTLGSANMQTTWRDITCPEPMRRSFTGGLPYGLVAYGDWLFMGEYTTTGRGEVRDRDKGEGECRVLRFNLKTEEWKVSGRFKARHVHAFHTNGVDLWVSIGDLHCGPQVGVAQLAEMGRDGDTWQMINGAKAPYTDNYGVNLITSRDGSRLFLAGDRPGRHIMTLPLDKPMEKNNIDTWVFGPSSQTETVRSLIMEQQSGDLYYWTAETTNPALYRCPPPYKQAFPIYFYEQTPVVLKSFQCHNFILMRDQRIQVSE